MRVRFTYFTFCSYHYSVSLLGEIDETDIEPDIGFLQGKIGVFAIGHSKKGHADVTNRLGAGDAALTTFYKNPHRQALRKLALNKGPPERKTKKGEVKEYLDIGDEGWNFSAKQGSITEILAVGESFLYSCEDNRQPL